MKQASPRLTWFESDASPEAMPTPVSFVFTTRCKEFDLKIGNLKLESKTGSKTETKNATSTVSHTVALSASVLALLLSACAHVGTSATPGPSGEKTEAAVVAPDAPATAADLSDKGDDLLALPLAVNRQVLVWIDYFQGQGRPHMERYLSRSTRYMPVMKKILKDAGVPEDLIYIALIESGFNGVAHSSANAVGYWQFIRSTGKRYGMKIDTYVDERRDFVRSTQAAADYFKGLYQLFQSWYLAIASYNVGEGRVKNLVVKYRTRDFWQLARENKLPDETSNYVPKYIAARLIAKEPEKYGFTDIDYQPPLEWADVEFSTSIDLQKLATAMGLEYDDLHDLNPAYKRGVAFLRSNEKDAKLKLRVPKGTEEKALAVAANCEPDNKKVYVADQDYTFYRVRRGDTISVIARKFGTSQKVIRKLNNLGPGAGLVAGRRLRVPADNVAGLAGGDAPKSRRRSHQPASGSSPQLGIGAAAKYMEKFDGKEQRNLASQAEAAKPVHIVGRGDTLAAIARRYRVSVRELARYNKISRRSKVTTGTRLEIPQ